MMHSENLNELFCALSKAQGHYRKAKKDSFNPFFKSHYSALAAVSDACQEALTNEGLTVIQTLQREAEKYMLVTILGHSSGQWIKSEMILPLVKLGPQEIGSCLTYCKRYCLAAITGVVSGDQEDDDDGERAQHQFRVIDEVQSAELDLWIKEIPALREFVLEKYKLKSIYDMKVADYQSFITTCKAKKSKKLKLEEANGN